MKKIISQIINTITIVVISLILLMNICITANLENHLGEKVNFEIFDLKTIITVILIIMIILLVSALIRKLNAKVKKIFMPIALLLFFVIELLVIHYAIAVPRADQSLILVRAQAIFRKDEGWLYQDFYMEAYPQQTTIIWLFSLIFKILQSDDYKNILVLNAIANVVTIIAIYKIVKLYKQKYETNTTISILLILTFIPIILLTVFLYGDLIGTAFIMLGIYFILKYGMNKKWYHIVTATILISISYLFRMNNLIFIIAVSIYLFMKALEEKKVRNYAVIIIFIIITILPQGLLKNYMIKKYDIDTTKAYPTTGFIYLGMSESSRAEGWYNDEIYNLAMQEEVEDANKMYIDLIKERLNYMKEHPFYCFKFYVKKMASMWTENTYGSVWYHTPMHLENPEEMKKEIESSSFVSFIQNEKVEWFITVYQKASLIIIMICVGMVTIHNFQKKDSEITLLLLALIGGFCFHFLWEAKSRYIVPYIIAIIPLTAIGYEEIIKSSKMFFRKRGIVK